MRHVLIVAVLIFGGFLASGPALAQQSPPPYEPASPVHVGPWCKVITFGNYGPDSYGYYKPCPGTKAMDYAPRQRHYR